MNDKLILLNEKRQNDLIWLVKARNKRKYHWSESMLRNILFIFAVSLSCEEEGTAIKKYLDFRTMIKCKSKNFNKSIISRLPSFCKYYRNFGKCRYKFTNDKIIQLLEIEEDELLNLESIKSSKQVNAREEEFINQTLEKIRIENEIEKSIQHNAIIEEIFTTYKDPIFLDESAEIEEDDA